MTNNNVLRFPNSIAGGAVSTQNVAARASEWIRKWFRRSHREQWDRERTLRRKEGHRKHGRIAREFHDTLFQGCVDASTRFQDAVEQMPSDSRNIPPPDRARPLLQPGGAQKMLEEELSSLRDELSPAGTLFRVFVIGRSKALRPIMHEQLYLIGREALINALRHSQATNIEAEIEYLPRRLRMVVRDNGFGIDPQVLRSGRNPHRGLVAMRERAGSIGAKLQIWSRPGFGTEVELSVPAGSAQ
jgi:light-regulated signal transduction histidine kinase (bacteriophytochrome)